MDISVNKVFKAKLRILQEEQYFNNQETTDKGYFKKLDWQSPLNFVSKAWQTISEEQIINGFNEIQKIYQQYELKYKERAIDHFTIMDAEKEGNMDEVYQLYQLQIDT